MDVDKFVRELQATYLHARAELLRSLSATTELARKHQKALAELDAAHAARLRSYGLTVEGNEGPIHMEQHDRQTH